jgi:hypothetical protein
VAVSQPRSVAGLSRWMHEFKPKPVHVGSVAHKVTMGRVFIGVILFPPVGIIPQIFDAHLLTVIHSFIHSFIIHSLITDAI